MIKEEISLNDIFKECEKRGDQRNYVMLVKHLEKGSSVKLDHAHIYNVKRLNENKIYTR